jgi:hypothetical protein
VGRREEKGKKITQFLLCTAVMAPMALSDLPLVEYTEIKLEKEIGTGNFSKVIRGIWKQKEVAVKKITIKKEKSKNDMLREFKSEVVLLRYPLPPLNICTIIEFF